MSPQERHFGIDLADEVVRGAIVTQAGEVLPPAPRAIPPPAAAPKSTPIIPEVKEAQAVALTPFQKQTREVALVATGMGTALALGKATGPLFMGNVFTFALAGLVGYRAVWGVVPALHSPLMSVTNAISGELSPCNLQEATNTIIRNGWYWGLLRYGRRPSSRDDSSSPRVFVCSSSIC